MIRLVILIVISIALTECVPSSNEVPPLKLSKLAKAISANEQLFGGEVLNFTKVFEKSKLISDYDYEEKIYEFGQQSSSKYKIDVEKCVQSQLLNWG